MPRLVAHDFDWIVIGSGFGGSVAALRLAEKGYTVGVVECGRRYEDDDYASTTWNWRRFLWSPRLGLKGIMRMTLFKDVFVLSGSGVGGGSLVYANTLYRPPERFFESDQWKDDRRLAGDARAALRHGRAHARRHARSRSTTRATRCCASSRSRSASRTRYGKPTVGVWFGDRGQTVRDPYFGGEGPDRTGCIRCGACMVGCRFNAKNTLVKNYLWLAERRGVRIFDERMATGIRPLGDAADGREGYAVDTGPPGAWLPGRKRRTLTAGGVVVAAGALGTNALLRRCKDKEQLPRLSERLGYLVRTNCEAILAVTDPRQGHRLLRARGDHRVDLPRRGHPHRDRHLRPQRQLDAAAVRVPGRRGQPAAAAAAAAARHCHAAGRHRDDARPGSWARRTIILLVMQTLDNSMRFRPRRISLFGRRISTQQDPDKPNPTFIPAANEAAEADRRADRRRAAELDHRVGRGHPGDGAHPRRRGDRADPDSGVVDGRHRVFGYEKLLVCDGAAVPANPGVNPSLTITAMAEHAMSHIHEKPGARTRPVRLPEPLPHSTDRPAAGTASGL